MHTFARIALLIGAMGLLGWISTDSSAVADTAQPTAKVSKKADRLWRAKCASCHGRDGKGQTEQGKKMKIVDMTTADWQKGITDDQIKKTMLDGIKRTENGVKQEMESFKGKLNDKKIGLLIERVRAFAP